MKGGRKLLKRAVEYFQNFTWPNVNRLPFRDKSQFPELATRPEKRSTTAQLKSCASFRSMYQVALNVARQTEELLKGRARPALGFRGNIGLSRGILGLCRGM